MRKLRFFENFPFGTSVVLAVAATVLAAAFLFTPTRPAEAGGEPRQLVPAAAGGAYFRQQAALLASDGTAQDQFGFAVAVSGDTAVVGMPRETVGQNAAQGAVYVYVRSGETWTQQQKLTASDGAATDQFGYAVAVSGNTLAVGRYNTTTGQNRADGKVYIFTRTGTVWTETQTIVSSDLAQGDSFGYALAMENDTLAVGARNKADGATFFKGAAYIFTRPAPGGNFAQQQKLTGSDTGFSDFFGEAVALSGDTAVIGSVTDFGTPNNNGKAYVFVRSGSSWTEQQILQAQNGSPNGAFGVSVAVSGDTAVIGANTEVVNSTTGELGAAYVFTRAGGTWTQQDRFTAREITPRNDRFGAAVAIRGDTLAIGSPAHEIVSGIANHGAVYVYQRSANVWARSQKIIHNDPAPDALGQSLAFDGTSILAGAPSKNSARGAAYVFSTIPTNGQFKVQPPEIFSNAAYGFWVGLSDETMAVSSNFGTYVHTRRGAGWEFTQKLGFFTENNNANNITPGNGGIVFAGDMMIVAASGARINNVSLRGAVLVYRRNPQGLWVEQQRLLASDGTAQDQFGSSIAVSGNTLAVGALGETIGANSAQGAIYVFNFDGSAWVEQQKLVASDGAAGDDLGNELAISGETIVAGVQDKTVNSKTVQGAVYVFKKNGGVWSEQQKLTASDGNFGDRFGNAVAIEGETIVAGAYSAEIGSTNFQGAAYVFTRTGTVWTERQKLFDAGGAAGDQFGIDVALNGGQLFIGASAVAFNQWANMGAVYVYAGGGGAWHKRGRVFPFDTDRSKELGFRLATAGNYLAATAPSDVNYDVSNSGSTYIFDTSQIRFASPDFDFDGDGRDDLSVFRPAERNWYLMNSTAGFGALQFGLATDKSTPADFDGDGKTDIAVWRDGAAGRFYILQSTSGAVREEDFGLSGDNPAFVGDWDGDGKADPAVYRDSTNHFYYRGSLDNPSGSVTYLPWGAPGDKPQRGDFDGDGRADAAVFRPSNGVWYIRQSSDGAPRYENWGIASDKFVPADYDGDGKTDLAVFRDGTWYIKQSSDGAPRYEYFGLATDQLVPADYDGDGKTDVAVFRNGTWYIRQSSDAQVVYRYFGTAGDASVPSAFVQ